MNWDWVRAGEIAVWMLVPILAALFDVWLLRLTTGRRHYGFFLGTAVFSMIAYFYVHPTCGCMGWGQILGAFEMALQANVVLFFLAYVAAFVVVRVRRLFAKSPLLQNDSQLPTFGTGSSTGTGGAGETQQSKRP